MVWNKLLGHEENDEDRAFIEAMLMISMADGEIEEEEIDDLVVSIVRHPKMKRLGDRAIIRILNKGVRNIETQGIDARIRWIAQKLSDANQRIEAIGMALSISLSDGDIEPQERAVLQRMQQGFGLTDEQIEIAMNNYR